MTRKENDANWLKDVKCGRDRPENTRKNTPGSVMS